MPNLLGGRDMLYGSLPDTRWDAAASGKTQSGRSQRGRDTQKTRWEAGAYSRSEPDERRMEDHSFG